MAYLFSKKIRGQEMFFPAFFPDGTRAVVRGVDSKDLKKAKIEGIIVNTYHLFKQPGDEFIKSIGGVKKFMNWDGFVISDSGGFQIMSLIHFLTASFPRAMLVIKGFMFSKISLKI